MENQYPGQVVCPRCEMTVAGVAAHKAGDLAMCFHCGCMAVYTSPNEAREISEAEFTELPALVIQEFQKADAAFRMEKARREVCPCLECRLRRALSKGGLSLSGFARKRPF